MCDKMTVYAYILKIVQNDPFLRLQMRAKEMFTSQSPLRLKRFVFRLVFAATLKYVLDS